MITILSGRHAADVFRHLRKAAGLTRPQLAARLHISPRTIESRDAHQSGYATDALVDTAAVFGFGVALLPLRHPGARPTGTGWPA